MGEISKPDTNPIIPAVLNAWFGGVGYLMIGQKKKGIIGIVATMLLYGCGLGFIPALIFAYDVYLLGQKLQSGQSIGENENGLDFLNSIFKD
ncbi:MAG: hypothetical protein ACI9VR_000752 [Cognaticolwellia sp.]|jgi:hypothetical protein